MCFNDIGDQASLIRIETLATVSKGMKQADTDTKLACVEGRDAARGKMELCAHPLKDLPIATVSDPSPNFTLTRHRTQA